MKQPKSLVILSLLFSLVATSAKAVNINLLNVNLGSPESQRASQLYGNAYGFPAEQVAPAMLGPAEEVPAILQVAQSAGTLPLSVWMMRKMGMSYSRILQTFAVAPLVSPGQVVTDPYYVETSRTHFLRDILQVSPKVFSMIPLSGPDFTHFIVTPIHPQYGYWMPPGIAKKYGYWMPPGQAKKMGWWGGDWDDDDHGHGKHKWKDEGKWEAKGGHWDHDGWGKGHGHGHGKHDD